MEVDPKIDPETIKEKLGFNSGKFLGETQEEQTGTATFISEIVSSIPGIDEAMSFT